MAPKRPTRQKLLQPSNTTVDTYYICISNTQDSVNMRNQRHESALAHADAVKRGEVDRIKTQKCTQIPYMASHNKRKNNKTTILTTPRHCMIYYWVTSTSRKGGFTARTSDTIKIHGTCTSRTPPEMGPWRAGAASARPWVPSRSNWRTRSRPGEAEEVKEHHGRSTSKRTKTKRKKCQPYKLRRK